MNKGPPSRSNARCGPRRMPAFIPFLREIGCVPDSPRRGLLGSCPNCLAGARGRVHPDVPAGGAVARVRRGILEAERRQDRGRKDQRRLWVGVERKGARRPAKLRCLSRPALARWHQCWRRLYSSVCRHALGARLINTDILFAGAVYGREGRSAVRVRSSALCFWLR